MKLLLNEVKTELEKCELSIDYNMINNTPFVCVYHLHDWDHGYDGHTGYQGNRREFYKDMQEILAFLFDYIRHYDISYFIAAPFHKISQFEVVDTKVDIYREVRRYLRTYEIRNESQSGTKLLVKGNQSVIEMIVEGAFRGVTKLSLLFPEQKVLISPHHHFNIPFYAQEFDKQKETVMGLLQNHTSLLYYERGRDGVIRDKTGNDLQWETRKAHKATDSLLTK